MDIETLYRRAVETGIANDLRPRDEIKRLLEDEKEKKAKLEGEKAEEFDPDRLFNPYADTRILFHPDTNQILNVRKVMVGIDCESPEIMLAWLLNRHEKARIDMVITHHPEGPALARLSDVMRLQADLLVAAGVTMSVAEQLMEKRIGEVERRLLPVNHDRAVDAARLLNMPFMSIHTPADNCVTRYLRTRIDDAKPARLKDLVDQLLAIPEYRKASRRQAGPKIVAGAENNRCGTVYVDMTGGTEGSKDIFAKQAAAGTSTLVGMHFSEDGLECARKANLNVVVAGHISSDTLGLNLLFDEVEKEETLEFVAVSGFERIRASDRP